MMIRQCQRSNGSADLNDDAGDDMKVLEVPSGKLRKEYHSPDFEMTHYLLVHYTSSGVSRGA
jgi:hypothetical protein